MAPAEPRNAITVIVVHCPRPGEVDEVELRVEAGTTLREAVTRSGLAARHPTVELGRAGIWGRVRPPGTLLHDGDRVELYRPLTVDPKEARRVRAEVRRRRSGQR
jgi:putative ubiquitin-RnfH superfamily antitoxin RatB of RatAB toxin-antitoxin module